jgi:hypothetical protein
MASISRCKIAQLIGELVALTPHRGELGGHRIEAFRKLDEHRYRHGHVGARITGTLDGDPRSKPKSAFKIRAIDKAGPAAAPRVQTSGRNPAANRPGADMSIICGLSNGEMDREGAGVHAPRLCGQGAPAPGDSAQDKPAFARSPTSRCLCCSGASLDQKLSARCFVAG